MTLEAGSVRALLRAEVPVDCFETLDSTSEECRRRIAGGETRCLVLAEGQTAGRGRCGRSFFSPPGSGLYMSLAFPRTGFDPAALTTYAAVCAADAVEALTGVVLPDGQFFHVKLAPGSTAFSAALFLYYPVFSRKSQQIFVDNPGRITYNT